MSASRISEREHALTRELRETTRSLVAMEADRDELLERLNTHVCDGPTPDELEDALEASQRVIDAIREDFDHLTTMAEGYKAQRDTLRDDIDNHGARDSQRSPTPFDAQTFAPGTVPMFQFDEMTRQRDEARDQMDSLVGQNEELRRQRDAAYQGSEPESQKKIKNLNMVIMSRESTISLLRREKDELTNERNVSQRGFEDATAERDDERTHAAVRDTHLRDARRDITDLMGQVAELTEERDAIRATRDQLSRERNDIRRKLGAVSREMHQHKEGARLRTEERDAARTGYAERGERITALQVLKASDLRAITEWRDRALTAEPRLQQAIGHIDSLTSLLTGEVVSVNPAGAATEIRRKYVDVGDGEWVAPEGDCPGERSGIHIGDIGDPPVCVGCGVDFRRKYLRDEVTKNPQNQTIAPDPQESPLEPRVVLAGPCAPGATCCCHGIIANDPDARPPFHRDCVCYVINANPPEHGTCGAVRENLDRFRAEQIGIDRGTDDRTGAVTWLAPHEPCKAREDGLHTYGEREGIPFCLNCGQSFVAEEQPPTLCYCGMSPHGHDAGVPQWCVQNE